METLKIIVGIIVAIVGNIIYVTSLEIIKAQILDNGKRERKWVLLLILGLIFAAIGGIFIGLGL